MKILDGRFLAIYLNDHLGGATAGLELARRAAGENRDGPLGETLAELAAEIEQDRDRLREIMAHLDCAEDPLKKAGGWGGEKLGRLKLNGRLLGYSPLSRLTELEALHTGVSGKLSLWQNLRRALGERLARFDLEGLIERAEAQLARIERHRLEVAAEVLAE